jgi:hypothetical protein
LDKQKLAADRVVAAVSGHETDSADQAVHDSSFDLYHVVGQGMGHKIDPDSAAKIDAVIASWADHAGRGQAGRSPRRQVDLVTYTLRYNTVDWLSVTGLRQHWTRARVEGEITDRDRIVIATDGVTGLKLDFSKSGWPHKPVRAALSIDGQQLMLDDWDSAPGIQCELAWDGQWSVVEEFDDSIRKRPGLQGPIDDAFCERFVFVAPSRPAAHGVVQRWIDREFQYAKERWSRLMRGDVRVVLDRDLTEEDIATSHLVCFGDFTSNQYLRGIAGYLPIGWTRQDLMVGTKRFDPSVHAAVFCYPNPRNPDRYLVVNSGMTFREFSNVSNSRQIAMLPDWAVLDVSVSDDLIFPGNLVAEGFFDERWTFQP